MSLPRLLALFVLSSVVVTTAVAQEMSLAAIHKVFVEKMPNDLDQYIVAEISKQMQGRLVVVLSKADADAVMRGKGAEDTSAGATIVSLVDRGEKLVLWSDDAADRGLIFGVMKGGPRKVAERLVRNLNKALEKAKLEKAK